MELKIKKNFKRKHLARMFAEKGLTKGVEIGVFHGSYSKVLCEESPDLELKAIDPYRELYREYETMGWGNDVLERKYQGASKLLAPYKCEIIRKTSLEAARDFDYESIDFVYIDGSHEFDYVMCDIIEWGKRVREGGIISGHDYNKKYWGVRLAVKTYAEAHGIDINLTADLTPSWWFERTW